MSGRSGGVAPIIIRKKKNIIAAGHHGGAWKVAYADFATAMMAFFLLMWLLNATTESQRKGLADYFNPSIPISRVSGGGSGALNGSSLMTEDTLANDGSGQSRRLPNSGSKTGDSKSEPSPDIEEALRGLENEINAQASDALMPEIAKHIYTRMTPEGLMIELVDADGADADWAYQRNSFAWALIQIATEEAREAVRNAGFDPDRPPPLARRLY